MCIRSTSTEEKLSQVELFCRETPIQIFYHAILQPVFPSLINFRGFGSGLQYIKWKTCSGLSAALTHINYAPSQTGCNQSINHGISVWRQTSFNGQIVKNYTSTPMVQTHPCLNQEINLVSREEYGLLSLPGEVTLVGASLTQLSNWSNPSLGTRQAPPAQCLHYLPLHLWAMQELGIVSPGDLAGAQAPDRCHTRGRTESLGVLWGRN